METKIAAANTLLIFAVPVLLALVLQWNEEHEYQFGSYRIWQWNRNFYLAAFALMLATSAYLRLEVVDPIGGLPVFTFVTVCFTAGCLFKVKDRPRGILTQTLFRLLPSLALSALAMVAVTVVPAFIAATISATIGLWAGKDYREWRFKY